MHSIFDFGLTSFFVSLCVISWIEILSYRIKSCSSSLFLPMLSSQ